MVSDSPGTGKCVRRNHPCVKQKRNVGAPGAEDNRSATYKANCPVTAFARSWSLDLSFFRVTVRKLSLCTDDTYPRAG